MKLTKTQKIGLLSIPVIVGIYLIYRQFKKPAKMNIQQKQNTISQVKNTPKAIPNPTPSCKYPLKKGLYNCETVRTLQKALNSYPEAVVDRGGSNKVLDSLIEDGDFGAKTEAYLIAVTSELAITKNSTKITYTWSEVPNENAFNDLVDEISQAVIDAQPYYPGVSAPTPAPPCNPLTEICY